MSTSQIEVLQVGPRPRTLFTPILLASAVVLVAALFVLYGPAFAWLADIWWHDDEYSHGMLVPFIAGLMAWTRRAELRALRIEPSRFAGAVTVALAAALLVAGRAGTLMIAEAISFLVLLPGLVLLLGGWGHLRILALPLAYLQFMVPWMDELLDRLHMPFQLLSANIGVFLLRLLNYNVFHDGKYIRIPGIMIEVAKECSGVRFFLSIIAIGIPLVYFTQRSYRKAAFVLITSMILAVLTNGARVAMAVMSASAWGAETLHGPGHIFQGWFVAQAGIVALFILNGIVAKFWPGSGLPLYKRMPNATEQSGTKPRLPIRTFGWAALSIAMLAVYVQFLLTPPPRNPSHAIADLPERIGEWRGAQADWINGREFFPNADSEIAREYRNPDGTTVYLYVAYFAVQQRGKSIVNYRANKLSGNGSTFELALANGNKLPVTYSNPKLDGANFEVLQWYRMPDVDLSSRYKFKVKSISDTLLRHHNNAAVVLIARRLDDSSVPNMAPSAPVTDFGRALQPVVRDLIP